MVHAWCVQRELTATKVSCPVWATSRLPEEVWTRAALPTAASGDDASIVRVTTPAEKVPLMIGRALPGLAPVGLLPEPPQPWSTTPRAARAAPWQAWTQNSRRV